MSLAMNRKATRNGILSVLVSGLCFPAFAAPMQAQMPILFRVPDSAADSKEADDNTGDPNLSPKVEAQTTDPAQASGGTPTGPLKLAPITVPNTSVQGIGTGILPDNAVTGRMPQPLPLPYGPDRDTGWYLTTKSWIAPVYCHQPTYYEDVMLEAHGHERCAPLQPLLSGARFYTGIFFTPYLAYHQRPLTDISSAGHYRPGSAAPAIRQRAPYDPAALRFQLLTTGVGIVAFQP